MVQTVADNETLGVSVDLINDYYLEGYTMEYLLPNKIEHFQVYPSEIAFRKGDEYIIKRIK